MSDDSPPTVDVGAAPFDIDVAQATHTVYVTTIGALNGWSVFDANTCNATIQSGCGSIGHLTGDPVGPNAGKVDAANNTLYTANYDNTATLDVGNSGGGSSALNIAANPRTNTIYATNLVTNTVPFTGNSVYVIDGATCDAQNTAGCDQIRATVTISPNPPLASNPTGIAVDERTNTIYTANLADGEHPGTVSVINGASCNGQHTTGCSRTPATAPAEFGPNEIAIDHATHKVYVTNIEDTSVSVINGVTCNGSNSTGCGHTSPELAVGDYPGSIAIEPTVATAYVQNITGVSLVATRR